MMNSLLYYYNNVQKMAVYRQAKQMQRGVITAQGGFYTANPDLKQSPFTIQCVIRPTKVTSTLQVAYNTKGDSSNPRVDLDKSGNIVIYGGGSILYNKPANLNSIYDIVFVATDSQLSLFVDGTLITSAPYANTISFYNIGFYFANNSLYFQGDYLLHRHFNYAMSADEVKALDNNGDPVGYVVPKAKRDGLLAEYLPQNLMESRKGPAVEPMASVFEFDIDSAYSKRILSLRTYPFECFYKIDYIVDEWDFQPQTAGSIGFAGPQIIGPSSWYNIESAKIGQQQTCYAKMSSTGQIALDIYGGHKTDTTTSRHLKVTIKGITPVSVPISWLDSAKQLPLSDEYMEPLFQSIGGYDMAANGAPEILYNE